MAYAQAIDQGEAAINQCPPGGQEGVARLAAVTGHAEQALNADNGYEGPLTVAIIEEAWCIGCTLCIKACPVDAIIGTNKAMHTVLEQDCTGCELACPVDAIIGTNKAMHTVLEQDCTGCELCIPACPVDCISLDSVSGSRTGWAAWSQTQADSALTRYTARNERLAREETEHHARLEAKAQDKLANLAEASKITDPVALDQKRQVVAAAIARAKAAREATLNRPSIDRPQ